MMWTNDHTQPRDEPGGRDVLRLEHGVGAAEDGEVASVVIVERRSRAAVAASLARDDLGGVLAHLDRALRDTGHLAAAVHRHLREIADDEHLGMIRDRAIALDDDPPVAVARCAE